MDKEIQEMFREKNKQIIKNNLQIDIETNIKSLLDTLVNIYNNHFDIAIKNINSIFEDSNYSKSNKTVVKYMTKLNSETFKIVSKLIEDKKNKLINKISEIDFNIEEINEYYDLVFATTDDIKNIYKSDEVYELKKKVIKDFDNYVEKELEDNEYITKSRINDYINYRLFGKIEERCNSEFILRDNNLANKAKESYEKFLDISNMTSSV